MEHKITPFLWFDDRAEEAMNFYVSIFPSARVLSVNRYGAEGPDEAGKVMTVSFELEGQKFVALNGGPHFSFTPAISFVIDCKSEEEVDHYWDSLIEGGKASQCGWLEDKFGLSWQIVPSVLMEMLSDPDPVKSGSVMKAMMQMVKLDIPTLRAAYENPS